jgi:hypothetical protein
MKFLWRAWGKILGVFAVVVLLGEGANLLFRLGIQKWAIPNWIILLVLVLLILTIGFLANAVEEELRKKGGVPQEEFDNLKKEFADYKPGLSKAVLDLDQKFRDQQAIVAQIYNEKIYGKSENAIDLEPTDEILTILAVPASNESKLTTRSGLTILYEDTHKGKDQADLNILIDKLFAQRLMRYVGRRQGEELIEITAKGLKYFDEHRKRDS